jgi:hypothetical protein
VPLWAWDLPKKKGKKRKADKGGEGDAIEAGPSKANGSEGGRFEEL